MRPGVAGRRWGCLGPRPLLLLVPLAGWRRRCCRRPLVSARRAPRDGHVNPILISGLAAERYRLTPCVAAAGPLKISACCGGLTHAGRCRFLFQRPRCGGREGAGRVDCHAAAEVAAPPDRPLSEHPPPPPCKRPRRTKPPQRHTRPSWLGSHRTPPARRAEADRRGSPRWLGLPSHAAARLPVPATPHHPHGRRRPDVTSFGYLRQHAVACSPPTCCPRLTHPTLYRSDHPAVPAWSGRHRLFHAFVCLPYLATVPACLPSLPLPQPHFL